jgi:hypothetical protein
VAEVKPVKAIFLLTDTVALGELAATDTIPGVNLPVMSETALGGVPATGTPSGLFLKDDSTWATPYTPVKATDADSDLTDALAAGVGAALGLLVVMDKTTPMCGLYRVENESCYLISGNEHFSDVKDTTDSINVYFETADFRIQNSFANNLVLEVQLIGVSL